MASLEIQRKCGFTFIWKIENFPYCLERTGKVLQSPWFHLNLNHESEWSVGLFPKGYRDPKYLGLFLVRSRDDDGPLSIDVDYELCLLGSDGLPLAVRKESHLFQKANAHGFPKFVALEEINSKHSDYLPENRLTVGCHIWKANVHFSKSRVNFGCTRIGIERKSFLWIITDFNLLKRNQKKRLTLPSSTPKVPSLCLSLYVSESFRDDEISVEMSLGKREQTVLLFCKIGILDSTGKHTDEHEVVQRFQENEDSSWTMPLQMTKRKLMSMCDLYLPNNTLTLQCLFTISLGEVSSEVLNIDQIKKQGGGVSLLVEDCFGFDLKERFCETPRRLSTDLRSLFEEGTLSDKQLRAQNKIFHVHKNILSARSPVFRAMFSNSVLDGHECDTIKDLDDETMKHMLLYLYTDSIEDIQEGSALNLYKAAGKYEILHLKDICSSMLRDSITFKNVCSVLASADEQNDQSLKKIAQDFILEHETDIFSSDEWETLMRNNAELAVETMHLKYKNR